MISFRINFIVLFCFISFTLAATYLPEGCKCVNDPPVCDDQSNCFLTPETRSTCPFVETDGHFWWTKCIDVSILDFYDPRGELSRSWVDCYATTGWIPHPCTIPEITAFYADHLFQPRNISVRLNFLHVDETTTTETPNWCTEKNGNGPDEFNNCKCGDAESCIPHAKCIIDGGQSWFNETCSDCSCVAGTTEAPVQPEAVHDMFLRSVDKMNEIWSGFIYFEAAAFQTQYLDSNAPSKTYNNLVSGVGFDTTDEESLEWLFDLFSVSQNKNNPSPYLEAFVLMPKVKDTLAITLARHMGGNQNLSSAIYISHNGGFDDFLPAWQNVVHETGHLLGLFHTFEGMDKAVGVDTCPVCTPMDDDWKTGDFIPDTIATGSYFEPGNVVPVISYDDETCLIEFNDTGACRTIPGGSANTHNIMSYDSFSCRDTFSRMQLARAQCFADMTFPFGPPSGVYLDSEIQMSEHGYCEGIMLHVTRPVTDIYCTNCTSLLSIERALKGDSKWKHASNESVAFTSFFDDDVVAGEEYQYRVTPFNGKWGPPSTILIEYPSKCNSTEPTTTDSPKGESKTRAHTFLVVISIMVIIIMLAIAGYWFSKRKANNHMHYTPMINT